MGCPEWEDADFDAAGLEHAKPDWTTVDLGKFKRPRWFAQGSQLLCINYLVAKRTGKAKQARRFWTQLSYANGTAKIPKKSPFLSDLSKRITCPRLPARFVHLKQRLMEILTFLARHPDAIAAVKKKMISVAQKRKGMAALGITWLLTPMAIGATNIIRLIEKAYSIDDEGKNKTSRFEAVVEKLIGEFAATFPERNAPFMAMLCMFSIFIQFMWH